MSKFFYIGMVKEVIKKVNDIERIDAFVATTSGVLIGDYIIDHDVIDDVVAVEGAKDFKIMSFKNEADTLFNQQVLLYNTSCEPIIYHWFSKDDISDAIKTAKSKSMTVSTMPKLKLTPKK